MPSAPQTIDRKQLTGNRALSVVKCHLSNVQRKAKGFTLIELLVVISIIAILITIIVATFGTTQQKARDSRRKTDLDALKKALELFKSDTRGAAKYPDHINTTALVDTKYIKEIPKDPSISTVNGGNYIYTPTQTSGTTCSGGGDTPTTASNGNCEAYQIIACLENVNDADAKARPSTGPAAGCPTTAIYIITNP